MRWRAQHVIVLLVSIMLSAFIISMYLAHNNHNNIASTTNYSITTSNNTNNVNARAKPSTSHKTFNRPLSKPSKRIMTCPYLDITDNKTWVNNTIKLLRLGRYLGFDKRIMLPSLYATYHYIASLSLLGMSPSNLNATLKYLYYLNKKDFSDEDIKLNNIIKIFYGVESLRLLGYKPLKSKELIEKILTYIRENEYKNSSKSTYIYYAISTLYCLNYNVSQLYQIKRLVIKRIEDLLQKQLTIARVSYVARVFETARLLGIDVEKIPGYEKFVVQLKDLRIKFLRGELNGTLNLASLRDLVYLFTLNHLIDNKTKMLVLSILKKWQKKDGGFSVLTDYGTPLGTHLAVEIYKLLNVSPPKSVIRFIYMHELPSGGFANDIGYNPDMCTISAIAHIAKMLGVSDDAKKYIEPYIDRWLLRQDEAIKPSLFTLNELACFAETVHTLDIRLQPLYKRKIIILFQKYLTAINTVKNSDAIIVFSYNLADISKELNISIPSYIRKELISIILSRRNADGSFGVAHRLDLTAYAVIALNELGMKYNDNNTIRFIQEAQLPNGGFTMRIGDKNYNVSLMPLTYLAVKALYYMHAMPKNVTALIKWLRSCEYKYGGFSLFPGSHDVDQDTTYWGLETLELLKQMGVINEKCERH